MDQENAMDEKQAMDDQGNQNVTESEPGKDRQSWDNPIQAILVSLGLAISMGSLSNFPYVFSMNGGAAFLLPYLFFMVILGIPMFLLQLFIGQNARSGVLTCWGMARAFKGIGVAMLAMTTLTTFYYDLTIGLRLHYFGSSFKSPLPWVGCHHEYNTPACQEGSPNITLIPYWDCLSQGLTISPEDFCYNGSVLVGKILGHDPVTPSQEYYLYYVLRVGDFGRMRLMLLACLFSVWVIVALCLIKGPASYGKVAYIIIPMPWLLFFVLGIRGWTLPSAKTSLQYAFSSDTTKLKGFNAWAQAAREVFFGVGGAYGGILTIGSYNKHKTDLVRNTLIAALGNIVFNIFVLIVMAPYAGFLAEEKDVPMKEILKHGFSFTHLPEVFALIPGSNAWAVLFYFTATLIGVNTLCIFVETINTAIKDQWPMLQRRDWAVNLGVCTVSFLIGIFFCMTGTDRMTSWIDFYVVGWNAPFLTLCCAIAVLVYGPLRFRDDLSVMTRNKWCFIVPSFRSAPLWMILIFIGVPIGSIIVIAAMFFISADWFIYHVPLADWVSGIIFGCLPLLAIFITPPIAANITYGSSKEQILEMFRPSEEWKKTHGKQKPMDYEMK